MLKRTVSSLAVLATVGAVASDARAMRRGDNAVVEQRLRLKAEWARARKVGGYSNPVTALINLFSGTDIGNAVQRVIKDPPPETIWPQTK